MRGYGMRGRWRLVIGVWVLIGLAVAACAPVPLPQATATATSTPVPKPPLADFAAVDPNYVYDQLYYMATHFLRREAGYDTNLPPKVNGHDEFAAYWTQVMTSNLQGFGPTVRRDSFPIAGWRNRPAQVPAFNVEVSVPGVTHPEQVVVIGCHYDAEAISTQSANDDASGCAIELGVAKALGEYWRSHHVYPARTLRFVIFDAEEQGLFGSFHYLENTVNGDVNNIVAMFNEEQSGIAYPLRFLGRAANPLLPLYVDMSPLQSNQTYPAQNQLSPAQITNITQFRMLMGQALPAVFQQFRALGFGALLYQGANQQHVSLPVFANDQQTNITLEDDALGASDEVPFTLAGLPAATFVGNATYYPQFGGGTPPPWSYPFDQPQDTIQLMNTYASDSSRKSDALALALALPGMLTTWMLNQPGILGTAPGDGNPIAAISDVGPTPVGGSVTLDARASYDPINGAGLSYSWSFGDGASASGVAVTHTYTTAGTYQLKLTVRSPSGTRIITKTLNVQLQPPAYPNPYGSVQLSGSPPSNPAIAIPTPAG
jgi:Peptidase family M28/PKD domain